VVIIRLMKTIKVRELSLAYREAGNPKDPALILLHGWPHSSALYAGVLDDLAANSWVLAFDLPGIGESRGAPSSGEKTVLADLVLSAAEALGAHSIVISGIDCGGMVAYSAARDHADRIVGATVGNTVIPGIDPWNKVIADPRIFHFAFHSVPKLPELLVTGHERQYFDFFLDFLSKKKDSLSDELRAEFTRAYERPEALTAGFDWYRTMEKDAARNSQPKRIDLPLLYLRGDADPRDINDYLAGFRAVGVTNVEGKVIANSGEHLPIEGPEEFCRVLTEFRATLSPAGRQPAPRNQGGVYGTA
jgi:pimeloyl-ACP methyl ester carboxylesterase